MRKADKKHINLLFKDGEKWINVYCLSFEQSEDETEENALMFDDHIYQNGLVEVRESEIESIEILP